MVDLAPLKDLFSSFWTRNRGGYMKLPNGRTLFYDFHAARGSLPTAVLLHGLGDRMEDLEALTRRFHHIGFGTLRVDLHGHGRTLELLRQQNTPVPPVIEYQSQIDDLEAIIRKLKIQDLLIVGHSYGGGIGLALGVRLERTLNVSSIHQLAPYVVRLDVYFKDKIFGGDLFMGIFSSPLTLRQKFRTYNGGLAPLPDSFMAHQYQRYFVRKYGKPEETFTSEDRAWIESLVLASIAATRGIRGYNAFHDSFPLPKKADLHLVIGDADPLVPAELLMEFRDHLLDKGLSIETTILRRADHFFPQTRSEEVFERILSVVRLKYPRVASEPLLPPDEPSISSP